MTLWTLTQRGGKGDGLVSISRRMKRLSASDKGSRPERLDGRSFGHPRNPPACRGRHTRPETGQGPPGPTSGPL